MKNYLYQYGWMLFAIGGSFLVYVLSPNMEEAIPMFGLMWVIAFFVDVTRKKHRATVEAEGLKMNIVVSMRFLMKKGRKTRFDGWTSIVHDSLENLSRNERYREYVSLYHRLVKSQPSGLPYSLDNPATDTTGAMLGNVLDAPTKYAGYRDKRLVLVFAEDELIWIGDKLTMIGANYLQEFFAEAKNHVVSITDNVSLETAGASK